jgi:hypothetical protein
MLVARARGKGGSETVNPHELQHQSAMAFALCTQAKLALQAL